MAGAADSRLASLPGAPPDGAGALAGKPACGLVCGGREESSAFDGVFCLSVEGTSEGLVEG